MAYYPGAGGAFGGFPGGYNQTPGGIVPNTGLGGVGGVPIVPTIGTNLPSVDPNNFAGTVHFGPSTTYTGQGYGAFPGGAGGFPPGNAYPGY